VLLGVSFVETRGLELVGQIAEKFPGVRILIVCDKSGEALAVEAMKAGAHGAMVKPLTLESVRKKVDVILGRGGAAPLVQLNII
jgi:DNA-binding response OmpR family regulator